MGENACVTDDGMSEIERAGSKLMEAIETSANLVRDAKVVVIDPNKPVEAIGDKDIVEAPRTVTDFIANMTQQVLAINDEMRSINEALYCTLGTRIHLK